MHPSAHSAGCVPQLAAQAVGGGWEHSSAAPVVIAQSDTTRGHCPPSSTRLFPCCVSLRFVQAGCFFLLLLLVCQAPRGCPSMSLGAEHPLQAPFCMEPHQPRIPPPAHLDCSAGKDHIFSTDTYGLIELLLMTWQQGTLEGPSGCEFG